MAPPKGNSFWKMRMTIGRTNKLTPTRLKNEAIKYFEWVEANPFKVTKAAMFQGEQIDLTEEKPRIMTIGAFCRFVGIGEQTLADYGKQDAYSGIVSDIKGLIYDYKLEGASAGLFNSNIIARELGLGERTVVELIEPPTAEDRKARLLELAEKCL